MYLLMKPNMELIKTTQGGLLFDRSSGMHILITATEAYILSLCNGSVTIDDIIDKVSEAYGIERSTSASDVKRFISFIKEPVLIDLDRKVRMESEIASPEDFKEIKAEKVLIPEKIMTLGISPTYDCSLRCEYCFAQSGDDKTIKKSLNLNMLKIVLRDAADLGAKKLDISGGDPINYKYLPELIKESFELGYRDITISTKGVSVTSEVAKRLRLAGLDRIQMSIDTMNTELYDSVVGRKGMFERMIRGWYNLRKEGFMIVNRATITNRTVSGVIELLKKNYSMGISNVRAVGVLHFGRGTNDMMPPLDEMWKLREDVKSLSVSYPNSKWFIGDVRFGDPYPCEGDISRIWVHPDGRVTLCDVAGTYLDSYPIFVFGNVNDEKLEDIWNKKIPPLFRTVRDAECKSCPISASCRGGCPLFSTTYYGDVMKAIPTCNMLKSRN